VKTIAGACVALSICLAAIWVYANSSASERFTYTNIARIEA
jgi:hypothetical protein